MTIDSETKGVYGNSIDNSSLTIQKVTTSEAGNFTCFVVHDIGIARSKLIVIEVIGGKPTVTTTQSIVSTDFGKEVTLRCIVNATPKITKIYWYKKINSQSHVTFIYAGFPGMSGSTVETHSLTIKSGTPANNGTYSCVAENIVGITGSEPVILIVRAAIPEVIVPQTPLTVEAGVDITLNCDAKSIPSATEVYWERKTNNSTTIIIRNSLQVEGSTVSNPSLTIQSASVSMSGIYKCIAKNPVGTDYGVETVLNVLESLSDIVNNESDDDDSVVMEAVFGTIGAIAALGTMIGGFITCHCKRREDRQPVKK